MRLHLAALATLLISQAAWCQEVVSNEPLAKERLIATLPLVILPKLDVDKVITATTDKGPNTWMISAPVAVSAVLASEQLPKGLKQVVNGIPQGDWDIDSWQPDQKEAMASALEHWKNGYIASDSSRNVSQIRFLNEEFSKGVNNPEFKSQFISMLPRVADVKGDKNQAVSFPDGSHENVNAAVIRRILTANRIIESYYSDTGKTKTVAPAATLDLNTRFANDIQAAYYPIRSMSLLSTDLERLPAANNAIEQAISSPGVAATLLINLGEAGLGQPLPYTAKDKSLNVEPSLARRYDIYWIDLAFSPSEELLSNVTELRYDVSMVDDSTLALDLLPIRFGVEASTRDLASVPNIKVGDVDVGEMFSRTVEYKHLLPTVLSHGLLTQSFGWSFTGDSLDSSAKRMFAVIGVPKGTTQISTRITLEAKCREYGGFASEWASTGPTAYTIVFPH